MQHPLPKPMSRESFCFPPPSLRTRSTENFGNWALTTNTKLSQVCHPEPFACHSERSEESLARIVRDSHLHRAQVRCRSRKSAPSHRPGVLRESDIEVLRQIAINDETISSRLACSHGAFTLRRSGDDSS